MLRTVSAMGQASRSSLAALASLTAILSLNLFYYRCGTTMSKKVDENYIDYIYDDNEEEEEEDRKCPPHRIPLRNLNEEEELSATGFKDGPRAQEHDPVAIEEAVLFNEKMVIKEEQGAYKHVPTSKHRAYGAQPDNSLGAEAVDDMQGRHSSPSVTEKGRVRTQESRPTVGAFRVGGIDIEEGYGEDEFT